MIFRLNMGEFSSNRYVIVYQRVVVSFHVLILRDPFVESPWAFAAGNFPTSLVPKPEPGIGRFGWLVGWLIGWLVGWLVVGWVGWLVG